MSENTTTTTTATDQPPRPAASLELGELIRRLIEAGIPFHLGFRPDVKGHRFRAAAGSVQTSADDAAMALLAAAGGYIRSEEKNLPAMREQLETTERRIADVDALLPQLRAHAPDDQGVCKTCGTRHTKADFFTVLVGDLLGVDAGKGIVVEDDDKEN